MPLSASIRSVAKLTFRSAAASCHTLTRPETVTSCSSGAVPRKKPRTCYAQECGISFLEGDYGLGVASHSVSKGRPNQIWAERQEEKGSQEALPFWNAFLCQPLCWAHLLPWEITCHYPLLDSWENRSLKFQPRSIQLDVKAHESPHIMLPSTHWDSARAGMD